MSAPAWMPLYVADFVVDTLHLSAEETGCYLLLIVHYWQHGGLPDDDEKLARICRQANAQANVAGWLSIRSTLAALFSPGWRHKRIDAELAKARDIIKKRRNAGKIGGKASSSKRQANATANVEQTSTPSPSPIPIRKKEKATPSPKKGCRIPDDFDPDIAVGIGVGMSPSEASSEAANFLDYWKAKSGAGATKMDWPATWRVWCRNAIARRRGRGPPAKGENPLAKIVREAERKIAARGEGNDWESGRAEYTGGTIIEIEATGKSPRSGRS
jgi:uncharacterized protein YdaU (DUF1376 family)